MILQGPVDSGSAKCVIASAAEPPTMAGPTPKLRASGREASPPSTAPTPLLATMIPITAGSSLRSRTMNNVWTVVKIAAKKL